MFQLEGSFFRDGDETLARLNGRITVEGLTGKSKAELDKAVAGKDGLLRRVEAAVEKKLGTEGVRFWSDGFTVRKGEVVWFFRCTIMDYDGFDGLASAIKGAFGKR